MKKILFLTTAVLLTIYFAGCKENSVTYNSKQNGTVSGKIQNWNLGSNKKLIAIIHGGDTLSISLVFDSCAIDNTGNFAMNLDTPPDSLLMLYKLNDTLCTHHTVIEPVDLNYCTVDFLVKDSVNSTVGFIYSSNSTLPNIFSGKINSYWYYFNMDASVMGTDTCNYGTVYLQNSNMLLGKMWSPIYVIYDSVTNNWISARVWTYRQDVQWYFAGIYDGDNGLGKLYQRKYLMKR